MFSLRKYIGERLGGKRLPWPELFLLFKEVMESNNRALQLITGLGEKLGGDYLFDINYIRKATVEIFGAIEESIDNCDRLTRGKHSNIRDTLQKIRGEIESVIEDVPQDTRRIVVPYDDIAWEMSREVGGKNFHLAEINNRLKLRVPPAFAITSHAFELFMEHNGLAGLVKGLSSVKDGRPGRLEQLSRSVDSAEMPPELTDEIERALAMLKKRQGGALYLAVRSSAEEEDGEFSFAGQFRTVLNVPADTASVSEAYKKVIASLYTDEAATYMSATGHDISMLKMAVGCMAQVDAAASGVMFTSSPGDYSEIMVSASWGLGTSVVDGMVEPDVFKVRKPGPAGEEPRIIARRTGSKLTLVKPADGGGTALFATPGERSASLCIDDDKVYELARMAIRIEKFFGAPQDVEWAIDRDGSIYILQSRPLKTQGNRRTERDGLAAAGAVVLMEGRGIAVQRGAGAGPVCKVKTDDDIAGIPPGAIVVSQTDSSKLVRAMPHISGIITDTGTPASHMASVCREFRVPTIVNAGEASRVLEQGRPVTLYVDEEGNSRVYDGILEGLVSTARASVFGMEGVAEYRKKRQALRFISPLHLVDPLMDDFTAEGCRTLHDILRFIHEKSIAELIDEARKPNRSGKGAARSVDLPIPAGLLVVDIGGGLSQPRPGKKAGLDDIASIPLASILRGMTFPGVWQMDTVPLRTRDFLSSMVRMPDIRGDAESYLGCNLAVASREYVNLNLRFGYHFNMVDSYCSENPRNNHIYFRFVGGATDIVKRSRRVDFISRVLKEFGFGLNIKGDLLIARLSNADQEKISETLDQVGRLIGYTRQLDARLDSDELVDRYVENFLHGDYQFK